MAECNCTVSVVDVSGLMRAAGITLIFVEIAVCETIYYVIAEFGLDV